MDVCRKIIVYAKKHTFSLKKFKVDRDVHKWNAICQKVSRSTEKSYINIYKRANHCS